MRGGPQAAAGEGADGASLVEFDRGQNQSGGISGEDPGSQVCVSAVCEVGVDLLDDGGARWGLSALTVSGVMVVVKA